MLLSAGRANSFDKHRGPVMRGSSFRYNVLKNTCSFMGSGEGGGGASFLPLSTGRAKSFEKHLEFQGRW